MGTIVESVHASLAGPILPPRSIRLASRAARGALHKAGCDPNEIEILIHTGLFRDANIQEPAAASFAQKKIGANTKLEALGGPSTFSFDLLGGGAAFIAAIQIIDGFMQSGRLSRGLVVTSDIDPTPRVSCGMDFSSAGASLFLAYSAGDQGFSEFYHESFPEHAALRSAGVRWIGNDPSRKWWKPKHAVIAEDDPGYLPACVACAATAMKNFLKGSGWSLDEIDLVIPCHWPTGFPQALRDALRLPPDRLVDVTDRFGAPFSAGIGAALDAAIRQGRFHNARRTCFVATSAGIGVSLALYLGEGLSAPDHPATKYRA